MQLGLEGFYLRVHQSYPGDESWPGYDYVQHHIILGPFIGYRYDHSSGFTADIHAGPAVQFDRATGGAWDANLSLVSGLNMGWSF